MKFTLSNAIKKIVLHLILWILIWFFFNFFFSVGSGNRGFIFWFSTLLTAISIVASYNFVYHLIPNYLIPKMYKSFILHSSYTIVFTICAVLITVVFGFVFFYNLEYQRMPGLSKNAWVILVCVFLIITIASSFKILKYNYKSLDEKKTLENKILYTQLKLKEQELRFLKTQIHPHFLFNTLNTIYGFALKKSDKAPEMILKLSNLLDYILYQIEKPKVLIKDEVNHIKNYISLEKLRFQDSLQVSFLGDFNDDELEISPMLLLPFVENAFKHGSQIDGILVVDIFLNLNESKLNFKIKNTTLKNENPEKGIGLENIKKRLEMLYKGNYSLRISRENNFFIVDLNVSLK